jgi:putative endonuclease
MRHAVSTGQIYTVYILASAPNGTLYIGVTNHLHRRVLEHRCGEAGRFTSRYGVKRLVWFEDFDDVNSAIQREKSLKRYPRDWNKNLIERDNPNWDDLAVSLFGIAPIGDES